MPPKQKSPNQKSPKTMASPDIEPTSEGALTVEAVRRRYRIAEEKRSRWTRLWNDCYAYTLPSQNGDGDGQSATSVSNDALFDGTAPDAVDQLAASLLAGLTPSGGKWFSLSAGEQVPEAERAPVDAMLKQTEAAIQAHLERSNLMVEVHQAFLDLVIGGSACLMFEEEAIGAASAFRFRALPLGQCTLGEGPNGRIERVMRKARLKPSDIRRRFPGAPGLKSLPEDSAGDGGADIWVIEAVEPERNRFRYRAVLAEGAEADAMLADRALDASPFLAFRWMKAPGEVYGRSPVMKALPDIKTANKVVELVLKNASIAVTGMWQADDDGVLNPANIRLKPGAIIPKAVGSAALRRLLQPKEAVPKRRLVTQTAIFWKDDWRAFLRGMIEAMGIEPIYERDKGKSDTSHFADYRKIIEMDFAAYPGTHSVFFNHQAEYDAIYEGRTHLEAGARLKNIYFVPGETGRQLGSLHALTLKSTTLHGVHYDSDDEEKAFLRLMKRVARKCSTNNVPVYKNDTGEFYSSDFKGHPVRFGYGALRWQRAEPNRLLDYGARAPKDWQFPEDHPWYQDEP